MKARVPGLMPRRGRRGKNGRKSVQTSGKEEG